ncbi:MAG: hypothetical protein AAGB11_01455 [Pseudomonadota bacterium]
MNTEPPREIQDAKPAPRRGSAWSDARAVLSAVGPVLFLPPALAIADREFSLFGVPALAIYVFSVWLGGIVLMALLWRRDRAG